MTVYVLERSVRSLRGKISDLQHGLFSMKTVIQGRRSFEEGHSNFEALF